MVDINRFFQIFFRKFGRHLVDIDVFERFFEDFKSSGNARKPLILLGFWGIDRPVDPVSRVLEPESSASANSAISAYASFGSARVIIPPDGAFVKHNFRTFVKISERFCEKNCHSLAKRVDFI